MKNLNDPRMPQQQKQYELQKATDPTLLKRQKEEARKGNHCSFSSYWVVKLSDLVQFSSAAEKTDTIFQLTTPVLKTLHPDSSVLMFETDRREAGEWDNFYGRVAPYSYQGVLCILINGYFEYLNDDGVGILKFPQTLPELKQYPKTLKYLVEDQELVRLGVLEIPLDQLIPFEQNRVHERTWLFSKHYQAAVERVAKDLLKGANKNPRWSVTPKTRVRHRKGFGA